MAIFVQSVPDKTDFKTLQEVIEWAEDVKKNHVDGPKVNDVYRKGNVVYVKITNQDHTKETLKYWDRKKEPKSRATRSKKSLTSANRG